MRRPEHKTAAARDAVSAPTAPFPVNGDVATGFDDVVTEFAALAERGETGAAFAVYRGGDPLVDLWGGVADVRDGRPWTQDTTCCIYSGSKGLVAVCLLLLIERGMLDLDAAVASYWPEFAEGGKDGVLVRHVVSHQAGLPALDSPVNRAHAQDASAMAALIAGQEPALPVGGPIAYHAMTYGWICGELLRRIDGRTLGRFFAEEVARPLHLSAWIGLPREAPPPAFLTCGSGFPRFEPPGPEAEPERELAFRVAANPERFNPLHLAANERAWLEAEIPGANGVATARSMARLYADLVAEDAWVRRLLTSGTMALARSVLSSGTEALSGREVAFGVGFALQDPTGQYGPPADAFGHSGAGGSVHCAWPSHGVGISYVTNRLGPINPDGTDERVRPLLFALERALTT